MASNLRVHMLRLRHGQEVSQTLVEYVRQHAKSGAFVMTCCGSVREAKIRFADNTNGQPNRIESYNQHFEVLSLSGTLSQSGSHLHICLSDHEGRTIGGHVMGDLIVSTTMEVALGEPLDLFLDHSYDWSTCSNELTIAKC